MLVVINKHKEATGKRGLMTQRCVAEQTWAGSRNLREPGNWAWAMVWTATDLRTSR